MKGTTRTPGWQPEETEALTAKAGYDCLNKATVPIRPEAVGWAPLVGRSADYLPSGTVGQWLPAPCNGGTCLRAATLEPTKRQWGRLGPRAGIPKRLRPNCHSCPIGTLLPAWVLHQGKGPQGPHFVKGKGPKDPGVEAPLHFAQSLGHWSAKARGVVGLDVHVVFALAAEFDITVSSLNDGLTALVGGVQQGLICHSPWLWCSCVVCRKRPFLYGYGED